MLKKYLWTLAVLLLSACTAKDNWSFKTDYLKIAINDKGYITSMKNIADGSRREFAVAEKPSAVMTLYNTKDKEYYYPVQARFDPRSKLLTVAYTNGSVAKILVEPNAKYIKMTLDDLSPRNGADDVQWGSYQTNITNLFGDIIGVARDTSAAVNYAIGVLALDDNTIGGSPDVEGDAGPQHYVVHSPDPDRIPVF